jgi:hypothetical protein
MVVHCLNFFNHYKFNMSVHKVYECQNEIKEKKTYRVHKIDKYSFVNIELKYITYL